MKNAPFKKFEKIKQNNQINHYVFNSPFNTFTEDVKPLPFYIDTREPLRVIPTSGHYFTSSLIPIKMGTKQTERQSRVVIVKEIILNFVIFLPTSFSTRDNHDIVRIVCLQDKQSNESFPIASDFMEPINKLTFFYKHSAMQRFNVLSDSTIKIESRGAFYNDDLALPEYPNNSEVHSEKIKCTIPVIFNESEHELPQYRIESNNITVFAISYNGVAKGQMASRVLYDSPSCYNAKNKKGHDMRI